MTQISNWPNRFEHIILEDGFGQEGTGGEGMTKVIQVSISSEQLKPGSKLTKFIVSKKSISTTEFNKMTPHEVFECTMEMVNEVFKELHAELKSDAQ